ncbi:SagB/ThcOx family dehydrogenase [Halodesulfovibrio sp.]|jgi:SagB-type dehydrogenase family enzyme|uniref:SagB/ThcOx family dehydrogenase n=1 Tax=Halodesulfovibrio sp. TaxID=1912772 RepID=UPI0025E06D65|nr:SagB/ThcOx family dehydrogenase [Halodesulfovibrio sp.]MCT4626398.1 SagB/ThcOx family dehydrogenase [Halodesulfovibrio sp.]
MITLKELYRPKTFYLDGNIKLSSSAPDYLSELYHENTKMHANDVRPWLAPLLPTGLTAMSVKTFFQRSVASFKKYDGYPALELPPIEAKHEAGSLWDVIQRRRCQRDYSDTPIDGNALAQMLQFGYGPTGTFTGNGNEVSLRAAPSAGALYPLEIYPLINNVAGIENGLYHYNVPDNSIECLRSGTLLPEMYSLIQPNNNEWLATAGAVFFVTAAFKRNQIKYGDRGYRGVLLDAGHVSQNILLAATALNYSACIIVACLDDPMNDFLQIDGVEESILFAISLGSPDMEKTRNAD